MLRSRRGTPARTLGSLLAAATLATLVAGCGSGASAGASGSGGPVASSNPQTLLRETFSASHTVRSGVLKLDLVVTPRGSSVITTPLSFTLTGPFQSRGAGKTPESSFTLGFSGLGRHGSFGVTTTASGAYIRLEGANYQLPSADYQKLRSSLASSASSGGAPGFGSLGVNPETWLKNPQIVGTETVDGVTTEHLHAGVDVPAVIASVNKLLTKEASTLKAQAGVVPHISAATAAKAAAVIRDPTVDVDTGKNDSTLRRMVIAATVPVTGTTSTELGGMTSASLRMTLEYSQLGTPQTISAPTDVQSYTQLQTKLDALGSQLEGALGGGLGAQTTTGSTGSPTTGSSAQVSKYAACIDAAANDVKKMQRCAKYLDGGG
jgi:hypothetical protein